LEELVRRLKKREGIIILKRLTINLDNASEKGTGLVSWIAPYSRNSPHPFM
jgi:hypothetical protein